MAGTIRQSRRTRATALLSVLLMAIAATVGIVSSPVGVAAADEQNADPANGKPGDGGETYLADALKEGTPEELQQRRDDMAKRLEDAGSKKALVQRLETEAHKALESLDAELKATQVELESHRKEAEQAEAELSSARKKKSEAADRAKLAEDELRKAAVDMFINPPEADGVRAALTGDVEKELASSSLLAGRTEVHRQVSERRDQALAAAARAEGDAADAATRAEEAKARVEKASSDISSQLDERNAELARIRADLDAIDEEVAGLQLTDSILASRLSLDAVARTGGVTTSRNHKGDLVPDTSGLPKRSEMVQIPNTSVWVHHLIAPAAIQMFAAAARDGVHMDGGGYRDPLRQIELRMQHCGTSHYAIYEMASSSCSPPTARPGRSMHERGLAIDFGEGGSALTRSSAAFNWLSQNASRFGFFNLPSEPWHWSVNGH